VHHSWGPVRRNWGKARVFLCRLQVSFLLTRFLVPRLATLNDFSVVGTVYCKTRDSHCTSFLPSFSVEAVVLFDSRSFESFVKGSGLLECHDLSSRLVSWQGVTCEKILASFVKLEKESFSVFCRHNVLTNRTVFLYNKTNQVHQFPKFTPAWNSTCFGQFLCPSSGVYSLYTQQWYM
jgi:hypothetical protein